MGMDGSLTMLSKDNRRLSGGGGDDPGRVSKDDANRKDLLKKGGILV